MNAKAVMMRASSMLRAVTPLLVLPLLLSTLSSCAQAAAPTAEATAPTAAATAPPTAAPPAAVQTVVSTALPTAAPPTPTGSPVATVDVPLDKQFDDSPFEGGAGACLRHPCPVTERDLSELAPNVAAYLAGREGRSAVAVAVPAEHAIYSFNGSEPMSMGSVVKVLVMMATLDNAQTEGRPVSEYELELLRPMITLSDNDATNALWVQLGCAEGVAAYLRERNFDEIEPNMEEQWGTSHATARAVARLFADIAFGSSLGPEYRQVALDLLSEVAEGQRWGVSAGLENKPEGTLLAIKDGWYPAGHGWWVNSGGVLVPGDGSSGYAIVVLTGDQPSLAYGIETIEQVSRYIHEAMRK